MSLNEMCKIIKQTILAMERPFNVSDLFYKLNLKGVTNRTLILEILDELCDNEFIDYSEINDDCWAFSVIKTA